MFDQKRLANSSWHESAASVGGRRQGAPSSDATQTITAAASTPDQKPTRRPRPRRIERRRQFVAGRQSPEPIGKPFRRSQTQDDDLQQSPAATEHRQHADHRQVQDAGEPQHQQNESGGRQPQPDAEDRGRQPIVVGCADPAQQRPPETESGDRQGSRRQKIEISEQNMAV